MLRMFTGGFLSFSLALALATTASAGPSIVFDTTSGQVIEHDDAFARWYPASLTKLMTIYVTFRAVRAGELDFTSPIKVSKKSSAEPPSKMGYRPDEVVSLDNALKILAVKSANDIATAVAENVGGTQKAFVARMNAEAQRLGMTGTHYANAHGLHDPDQYTTARDLAVLVTALRNEFPEYAGYFAHEAIFDGKDIIKTNVVLLGRFAGADGMKTGFICASGFNMVASATRGGRTVAAVVLGATSSETRAEEASALLARGFAASPSFDTTLASLKSYGDAQARATDLRKSICSKKATGERWLARDEEGNPVYHSPYMTEMTREPIAVAVGTGNAPGPVPKARAALEAAGIEYADVPIPSWRPDRPEPEFPIAAAPVKASAAGDAAGSQF